MPVAREKEKSVANTFREFASAKAYIMLNLAVLCCVAGISYSVIKLDHDHHLDNLKQDAQQALHEVTSQVQNQFQETVLVTKNIENILLSGEAFKDKKIELLVKELCERNPGILAFALAPDLKVSRVFSEHRSTNVLACSTRISRPNWPASPMPIAARARPSKARSTSCRAVRAISCITRSSSGPKAWARRGSGA